MNDCDALWYYNEIILCVFDLCFLCFQSRLTSQTEAMALQTIRSIRGNGRCADCDAQSEFQTGNINSSKTAAI